ncbi:MAG: hypothetical protein ABW185_17940, partial [Sedimenticola sp.]
TCIQSASGPIHREQVRSYILPLFSQIPGTVYLTDFPETLRKLSVPGNWKLETGNWKLETGNWKLETGNWKLETGNCPGI